MLKHAVLVNKDFIVCSHFLNMYEGDIQFGCNAIMMLFVKSKQSEMEGGTIYAEGCLGTDEAAMLVATRISKFVYTREPVTSEEMCAIEFLKERGVETVYKSENIL